MEFPKALYKHGVVHLVHSVNEEEVARADGFNDWQADHDAMNAKLDGKPLESMGEHQHQDQSAEKEKDNERQEQIQAQASEQPAAKRTYNRKQN